MTATTEVVQATRRDITKPVNNRGTLKTLVESMRTQLADVIPKHLTPERVMKMALVAASRQPKLLECTQESIMRSVMDAASLGLDCSGVLGSAYLVPYKKYDKATRKSSMEAQFIPGYQGLIDLARRGGAVLNIQAHAVYERDAFALDLGCEKPIRHEPYLGGDRGAVKYFYAMAWLRDNPIPQVDFMSKADVDKIRGRSKASEFGPWASDYDEMGKKTVVRRLCKYLPKSVELERALEADARINDYEVSVVRPTTNHADRLAERLAGPEPAAAIEDDAEQNEQPDPSPPIDQQGPTAEDISFQINKMFKLPQFQKAAMQELFGEAGPSVVGQDTLNKAFAVIEAISERIANDKMPENVTILREWFKEASGG